MINRIKSAVFTLSMALVAACGQEPQSADAGAAPRTDLATAEQTSVGHEDTSTTTGQGRSEFSFSGGLDLTVTGQAMHTMHELASGDMFMLALYTYKSDANYTAINVALFGQAPEPGVYDLGEESEFKTAWMQTQGDITLIGHATSGQLEIVSAAGTSLSGTLRMSGEFMTNGDLESGAPYSFEATFEAVAGKPTDLPGQR